MFCFIAGLVLFLRQDPWSWPGMTVSLALVVFCGCLLVFRQKNIRTKVCIEEFNIHSNGFDVYSNSLMLAPAVLSLLSFLLYKNRRIVCFSLFSSYKNVFYNVNTSLACLMDISRWQAGACSCMPPTNVCYLHSYVLLFLCLNNVASCLG